MPSINNPFTSGTSLAITTPTGRYPLSLALYANTSPGYSSTYSYTFSAAQISNMLIGLAIVLTPYGVSGNNPISTSVMNPFGMTPNQVSAINTVISYFNTISAGTYVISASTLNAIVIVSEMMRLWNDVNINMATQANIITQSGQISKLNIVSTGYGFTLGGPFYAQITGGTGSGATAEFIVSSIPSILSLNIVSQGSGYGAPYNAGGTYTNVPLTGGSGNSALATIVVSSSNGIIAALDVNSAGTLYTNGTYTNVPLYSASGASGSGAAATIVVSGTAVTSVTLTAAGTGYIYGQILTALTSSIGGTGSGANFGVAQLAQGVTQATIEASGVIGQIVVNAIGSSYTNGTYTNVPLIQNGAITNGLLIDTPGSSYTFGTYTNVPLTGGTGSGAKATIVISSTGNLIQAIVTTAGTGYVSYDVVSFSASSVGGTGSGGSLLVNALGHSAIATIVVSANVIAGVTITSAGIGYSISEVLTFSASNVGGTGSGGSLIVTDITTSLIAGEGTGYKTTDILSVSSNQLGSYAGSGFTATPNLDAGVTNATIISGGFGYSGSNTLSVNVANLDSVGGSGFTMTPIINSVNSAIVTVNSTIGSNDYPLGYSFPVGATTIVSNDGYFLCERAGTGNWYVSNNQDGSQWSALMTATIETRSDQIVAIDMFAGGIIIVFGTRSMEFWFDNGVTPFPYVRETGQQQDWGLAAKWSRAYFMNTIAFLGQNLQGQAQVMMINGYSPVRISTSDIEYIINSFPVINDALAYSYIVNGHSIYRITFPTANRTFDYDGTTGIWNEAMSGLTYPNRHLTSLGITYNNCDYASDCVSGSIYYLDSANYTDNGSYVYREVDSIHIQNDGNEFGIDEVFLDMQLSQTSQLASSGDTAPVMSMYKSVDNGNTFGAARTVPIGTPGSGFYSAPRVIWRRLGSARDFVLKFTTQSAIPFIIAMGSAVFRKGTEK